MKNLLITGLLVLGLGVASVGSIGCTTAQVREAEKDLIKALQIADAALVAVANNPKALADAELALASLAVLAPQSGPIHQAIIDAQAALNALQRNQGTLGEVQAALGVVISLLEAQGKVPLGAVRRNGAIAPVGSK